MTKNIYNENDDMHEVVEKSCNVFFFVNFPFKMFLKIDLDKRNITEPFIVITLMSQLPDISKL